MTLFTTVTPPYAEVLEVPAGRVARWCAPRHSHVGRAGRDAQASVARRVLGDHPLLPARDLEEEWEHHRFAVRDLDAIEARSDH
jgi:hypothetical protein